MTTFYIEFAAAAPLQIGAGALGMIELCQCHIPGRVIWGALVNSLCSLLFTRPDDHIYRSVGEAISVDAISTFFPLLPKKPRKPRRDELHRFIPCFPLGEHLAADNPAIRIPSADVRSMMLCSIASTAVSPQLLSATDETLHSNDLIAPYLNLGANVRDRFPSSFAGYLELPEQITVNNVAITIDAALLHELFTNMRIGGGRKRGWGIIRPLKISPQSTPYRGYRAIAYNGDAQLLTSEKTISATDRADGRARLQSFREYDPELGFGRRFTAPEMVWQIGTVLYA